MGETQRERCIPFESRVATDQLMTLPQSVIEPELSPTRPLGPWANGVSMSAEEFDAAAEWDDAYRYELVRGVLIVSPAPGDGERLPNDYLGYVLRDYQRRHPNGGCLDGTVHEAVVSTPSGRRRMDRALWIGLGRRPSYSVDPPAIAIEFVSDTSRDRRRDYVINREEYSAIGVREYWVIDRFRRSMTVFVGADVQVVSNDGCYQTPLLPGFELRLSELWDEAGEPCDPSVE